MKKLWKKVSAVSLAVSLSILTACGGGGSTPSNTSGGTTEQAQEKKAENVQLRWMMWTGSDEEKKVWEALAAKVTEKHPEITVKFETDSFPNYWDKLQTQVASGSAPDIISMQSLRMPTFATRGALEPLNPFIENSPEFKIENFDGSILDALSWDGKIMAIPYDLGPYILYYNKDLFDKYGVAYPDENMDWAGFLEKAKATTQDGNYGYVMRNVIDQVVPWIWANGGNYMNEEKTKSMINEKEAAEAIQFLSDLMHKHKVTMPITDPGNDTFYREQFYAGKVAMYLDGPWNFGNVRAKANFKWDITTIPQGKGEINSWVAGSGFGINPKSKHKEEAWKAISVMMGEEGFEYLATTGRAFPARSTSIETFKKADDRPANMEAVSKAALKAKPFAVTTNWQETQLMINRELDKIWFNNAPVQEVLDNIQKQMDPLLEKHQKTVSSSK
ncbi:sugar ABC transporter substrate-binding protein [Ammoniphilus sp. YIM 78166]|uniref:ABC transporter substrate-binding protein n=1 Tax=Ammoniphilus sp. YIM 78166 TaxID=1644106 RepID=UPI0010700D3F|nr:sugar ABC transporter substrate-binding protein [Ammoniphilus sp. YIM 78166]